MNSLTVLLLCFGILFTQRAAAIDWSGTYERSRPSVPILLHRGGICSGSLIDKDLVLTAHHCVGTLRTLHVRWEAASPDSEIAQVVAMDREKDLALVRLQKPRSLPVLEVRSEQTRLKIGEPLLTIGHPVRPSGSLWSGLPYNSEDLHLASSGIISGVSESDLITDASFSPGNSGGPILAADGKIIGVVSRKRIESRVGSIGYGAHHRSVHQLLDRHQKEGDQIPTWRQATSPGFLRFSYSIMDIPQEQSGLTLTRPDQSTLFSGFEIHLGVHVKDRWTLGTSIGIPGSRKWDRVFTGPLFVFDSRPGMAWTVQPSWDLNWVNYRLEDSPRVSRTFQSVSLSVAELSSSLGIRISKSLDKDFDPWMFSVELGPW